MNYKKLHPTILLMTIFCLFMINKSNAQNATVIEPSPEHYSSKSLLTGNRTAQTSPIRNVSTNNAQQLNEVFNLSGKSNGVAASPAVNCYIPPDATYTNFPGNDDGSTAAISLPFAFSLYGINYTSVYINNNGNLTFTAASSVFSPVGFPFNIPMVAPFWADVDTRIGNTVKFKVNPTNLIVTWPGVGYFNQQTNLLNTFQVIISNGNDPLIGLGNNVAFYYGDMQWTTGSASGGIAGYGGFPATAGINQGDGINYIQIGRFSENNASYIDPLSLTSGINHLDLGCYPLTAGSLTNLQPSVSGIPANNTLNIACGETGTINLTALPPEVGQNVSVAIDTGGLCNTTIVNATNGTSSNATVSIVGGACNQGTHNISFVFTDNFNPSASTTVNITVVVGTAPVISCPSNITVSNTSGQCGANVSFAATAIGNLAPTLTYSPASGSFFPVGTTTVTATATNDCGSDTCTFDVTVNDTQPPAITCPANIAISNTPGTCSASVTVPAPTITENCSMVCSTDSLDEYTTGLVSGQSPQWVLWPGGQSGVVSTEQFLSAPNSLKITGIATGGPVDQVFKLGNQTSGNWETSFSIFVAAGHTAYYNLQHNESLNSWAQEVTFNSDGIGKLFANGIVTNFSFPSNQWFKVKQLINQSTDQTSLYVNGVLVYTWQFSKMATGAPGENKIGAYNFYPKTNRSGGDPNTAAIPLFYVDDVSLCGAPVTISNYIANRYSKQYPLGTTTNNIKISDLRGNPANCTFTVTVNDTQPPVITCPANITVNNTPGQCGANVSFAATATDNCGTATLSYSPASGSLFNVGTTPVTATADDGHGNTASCTFTVTVNDTQLPEITCPAAVTVNANAGQCYATNVLLGLSLPIAIINPDFEILYKTGSTTVTSPLFGVGGGTISPSNINMSGPTVTFSDGSSGNGFDLAGWTFNTQMGVTNFNSQFGVGRNMITWMNGATFGGGTAEKTMSQTLVENLQQNTTYTLTADFGWRNDNSVASPPVLRLYAGATLLTPVASNSPALVKGSFVTYSRTYLVNNNGISGPLRIEFGLDANTNGQQLNTDHVTLSKVLAIDNCAIASVIPTLNGNPVTAATQFSLGNNTVVWTATDTASNTATCNQTVTVNDTQLPVITCPANITVNNTPGQCGANVSFAATATDNCGTATLSYSPASGSLFNVGTTPVTATADDGHGNTSSCTFTVTVNDTQPPTIICPANIDADLSAGQCGAFVSFAASASDNCGTADITYSHAPGSLFNVGTTTVTATADDGHGNTASCTFTVRVDLLDHVNLQWPPDATICPGSNFTAYGQVSEPNVTTVSGSQGANIEVQFGYSTTNTNPSGWSNWYTASYNSDFNGNPNNDEYYYNFSSNVPGTYYYTFRYRQNGCTWQYGGFKQWDGGTWDGVNNVSGVLTVQSLDWANLQWPPSARICQGASIIAYGQVYEAGVTTVSGDRGAGIDVQFGYSTTNTNPSGWSNWTALGSSNFNALGGGPSNDEYMYEFYPPSYGTYYYTFRYRLNGCLWQYGGYSSGGGLFWDGTNFINGTVTVDPTSVGGAVSGGTSPICSGFAPGTLTLSGHTGAVLQWESSTDNLTWYPIANTSDSLSPGVLLETTQFRAAIRSGVCLIVYSDPLTITVYQEYPFYADNDSDGYGVEPSVLLCSINATTVPEGYSLDNTDCDDSKGDRHQTYPFYVDADGDTYGAAGSTAVDLCAINASTPPLPNYSVNNTDCNDAVFAINPGVYDIPYDSIDNNCDGSLFDGHAPIVVYVLSPSCGGINHGLNNTINCTEIYLGEGYVIGYRFKVTNLVTGEVAYVDTVQHHFKLTDTSIYSYGTPYSIQVAAIVNGEVQPFNGPICTLTTTSVATTKVIASQCGSTLLFMYSTINATAVNSAISYRFRVARADSPGIYYYSPERTSPNFNLTLLTVPVGFLTYATEYKVDVQIKIKLANLIAWSQFGQVCSIFTPPMPDTSLVSSQCEMTATSNTQVINTTPFAGATLYRFRLTLYNLIGDLVYSQYVDTPNPYFTLSMFTGLLPDTTYTVSVTMKLYGTFVDYGKDCSVTTPLLAKTTMTLPFKAVAHPNPFAENFMIDVKSSSESTVNLKVYDMIGRLVEQHDVRISDLATATIGERYPSGVYNVVVSQDENLQTVRVVKR